MLRLLGLWTTDLIQHKQIVVMFTRERNFIEVYFPTAAELILWKYQALLDCRTQTWKINIKLYFDTIQ